jgi:aldehyde:ferredoxin oxidoreductase
LLPKILKESDMPHGYSGKILHVDLSSASLRQEEPSAEFYRKYIGGSALNLYYLLKQMPVGVDPLGSDNILALSVGVVTGVPISGQSRMTASANEICNRYGMDTISCGATIAWAMELFEAGGLTPEDWK